MPYISENTLKSIYNKINELILHLESISNGSLEASTNLDLPISKNEELLSMKILTDENWSRFLHKFRDTHSKYYYQIYSSYFEVLSKAEFRILLLLKLTKSNDKIASILGISKDSVRICIYRTRCKLNIKSKNELFELLNQFQEGII